MNLALSPNSGLILFSLIFALGMLLQGFVATAYLVTIWALFFLLVRPSYDPTKLFPKILLSLIGLICFDLITGLHWNRSLLVLSHYFLIGWAYQYCRYSLNSEQKKSLALVILIIMLINALGGIYQVFMSSQIQPLDWVPAGALKRAFGLFDNPNLMASCLMMSVFLSYKFRGSGRLGLWLVVLLTVVLVLTQSRGAILGSMAGLLIIFVYGSKQSRLQAALLGVICLSGFIYISQYRQLASNQLGVNQRIEMFKGVQNYLQAEWFSGSGAGTFHLEYPYYRTLGGMYPFYAHNHILEIWCELGLAGLILILIWILSGLKAGYEQRRQNPIFLAFMIACLINSSTNQSFSYFLIAMLFAMSLALIDQNPEAIVKPPEILKVGMNVVLISGTLASLALGIYKYQFDVIVSKTRAGQSLFKEFSHMGFLWKRDLSLYKVFAQNSIQTKSSLDLLEEWSRYLQTIYPRESEIPFQMARAALQRSELSQARVMAYRALALDPFSEQLTAWLMNLEYQSKRYDQVIVLAEKIIGNNPQYEGINPWYDKIYQYYLSSLAVQQEWSKMKTLLDSQLRWTDSQLGVRVEQISRQAYDLANPESKP